MYEIYMVSVSSTLNKTLVEKQNEKKKEEKERESVCVCKPIKFVIQP